MAVITILAEGNKLFDEFMKTVHYYYEQKMIQDYNMESVGANKYFVVIVNPAKDLLPRISDAVIKYLTFDTFTIDTVPHTAYISGISATEIKEKIGEVKEQIISILKGGVKNAEELAEKLKPLVKKYGKPAVITALKIIAVAQPEYAPICYAVIKLL